MMRLSMKRLLARRAVTTIAVFLLALAIPMPACKALVEGRGHQCAVDTSSGDHLCCAHLSAAKSNPETPVMQDVADCATELRTLDPVAISVRPHLTDVAVMAAPLVEAVSATTTVHQALRSTQERAGPSPPLFILHSAFLI
jgi:hypothetical protein